MRGKTEVSSPSKESKAVLWFSESQFVCALQQGWSVIKLPTQTVCSLNSCSQGTSLPKSNPFGVNSNPNPIGSVSWAGLAKVKQQVQGHGTSPSFGTCETTGGGSHPVWDSPVQEGHRPHGEGTVETPRWLEVWNTCTTRRRWEKQLPGPGRHYCGL